MSDKKMNHTCQCHLIDWTGGPGNYKVISTGELIESGESEFCCQEKVNDGIIDMETYLKTCNCIPGEPGSLFPQTVFDAMIAVSLDIPETEGIPPISEHMFKVEEEVEEVEVESD